MNIKELLENPDIQKAMQEAKELDTPDKHAAYVQNLANELALKDNKELAKYKKQLLSETQLVVNEAKKFVVKRKLEAVMPFITLSEISRQYFGNSRQWLYQRINEDNVNGKPAEFTGNEIKRLSEALEDIADRLKSTAA
ncbi:MAG: DUF5053 domain-containing protein, partial [Prevotellaceae bacterium]|nr:DUF5053 domain-containing protein [Prevotellaceae bacterium]